MLDLKCNSNMINETPSDFKCSACGLEDESQLHVMQCDILTKAKK